MECFKRKKEMSKIRCIIPILSLIVFSGCDFFDNMFEFDSKSDRKSNLIDYIVFDKNESHKRVIITSECRYNEASFLYYETMEDAHKNIYEDTKNLISEPWSGKRLKPHWDIRYVNPIELYKSSSINFAEMTGMSFNHSQLLIGTDASKYNSNASVSAVKCVGGEIAAGTTVNLNDAPEQILDYGGPHSTFIYRLSDLDAVKPWSGKDSRNLLLQANFTKPKYIKSVGNIGGGINFGLFLRNVNNGKYINYVIGAYSAGEGWMKEQSDLKYDTTTKIVHVSTTVDVNSFWSTMSPKSTRVTRVLSSDFKRELVNSWDDFFRVNITYDNMMAVLHELKYNPQEDVAGEDYGLNPEEWELLSVMIQYELEEEGGKAILSGSFKGFEVYSSKLPL